MSEDWESNWKNYKGPNFFGLYRLNNLVKHIMSKISLPCNIIDIGIGPGDLSALLKFKGYSSLGIDNSKESIKICSTRGLNSEIGDAFNIKYPDSHFDMSLSDGLLEHFENDEDKKKLLAEHIRVSKKYIVVSLPSTTFSNTLYRWLKPYDVDEYRISFKQFKKLCAEFPAVKIIKSGHYNLRLSYYVILEKK